MNNDDQIEQELIDAYRKERAPTGFAQRAARAAQTAQPRRDRRLLWAVPAAAVLALAVLVWNSDGERANGRVRLLAVSFSAMPSGLPTFSNTSAMRLPSIAALDPIPAPPTLNPTVPAVGRLKTPNQPWSTPSATPN